MVSGFHYRGMVVLPKEKKGDMKEFSGWCAGFCCTGGPGGGVFNFGWGYNMRESGDEGNKWCEWVSEKGFRLIFPNYMDRGLFNVRCGHWSPYFR